MLIQCTRAEPPGKPLAVLPAFPSAVTAVAFSERSASGAGSGAAAGRRELARGAAEDAGAGEERGQNPKPYFLAVGLESGALEVWAVALGGGRNAAASVSGNLVT